MARINFAKNFAGEIYATQNWTTAQINEKVASLGNVFELKGYANEADHSKFPWEVAIEGLGKGDVFLVDITTDGVTETAEYICVNPATATVATGFEKLGTATAVGTYATLNYVDGNFVKRTQLKGGKGVSVTEGEDKNFTFEAIISNAEGNKIQLTDAGLYVAECEKVVLTEKDTATVDMTVNGYEISADVKVSAEANNILEAKADGLYVAKPLEISVEDTATVDMEIANGKITSLVKKSAKTGNILTLENDGLFVPTPEKVELHSFTNTATVDFTVTDGLEVTADVNVSAKENNILVAETDGLYVAKIELSEKDTATVDVTVNGYEISADVKVSADSGNALSAKADGLFVQKITVEDTATIDLEIADGKITASAIGLGVKGEKAFDYVTTSTAWQAIDELDAAIKAIDGELDGEGGVYKRIEALEAQVGKNTANIATNKSNIDKINEKLNNSYIQKSTDKNTAVSVVDGRNIATVTMAQGEVVYAVVAGGEQVYPEVKYVDGVATLTADYGTLTPETTWTIYYGVATEFAYEGELQ